MLEVRYKGATVDLAFIMLVFSLFFFREKTADEVRLCDWSSDVCSSDLRWKCGI